MIRYSKIIFFLTIFLLTLTIPAYDYDLYFHIKSGEVLVKNGLIHHDVFSYNTNQREWFPYEWLFQIAVYFLEKYFGVLGFKIFTSTTTTLLIFALYKILTKILSVNTPIAVFTSFFFFVSVFDFITPRPHLPAYSLLLTNLFLILLYIFKNKNLLILTLPVTLIWSNFHGSIILNTYLFLSYTVIASEVPSISRGVAKQSHSKTLFLYTLLTAVITILPPIGFLQYRLLYFFFQKQPVLSNFIDEWRPLNAIFADFDLFKICLFLIASLFVLTAVKAKSLTKILWALPLIPFLLAPYLAVRNLFLAYITLSLLLGFILSQITNKKLLRSLLIPISIFYAIFLYQNLQFEKMYLPTKSAQFIKNNNFNGRLYNGIGVGGYLLYYLYPNQKVFIDGRTDLYLASEIPDLINLAENKDKPEEQFKPIVKNLLDKYQISYALLVTKKNNMNRKISSILVNNPDWHLVYWDDDFQIFVKMDGKNEEVIKKFAASSATPYSPEPFKKGDDEKAFTEYQKMVSISDSARSRNALGYIYLKKNDLHRAKIELEKAISLDANFESPYMNLGEIAVSEGDFQKAANLYQKAVSLAPERNFARLRLEEIKTLSN